MATTQLLPVPPNEQERLAALRSLCILDTPPEAPFEHLTALAATHFNVPIAAISLVDEHRQFFKSIQGTSIVETSRETSFCTYTLLSDDPLIVPDAQKDDRFRENALVVGEEHLRFYAGASLITSGGMKLGSFCVIDRRPRPEFHMNHFRDLERFAAIASRLIEQRLLPETLRQTRELNAELQLRAETEITASQAKTDFLNNISHEIRTPMNGVLGMIQLLASTELSAEQRNYAKVAKSCGGMLVALLDDVLDLSKIEAGKTVLEDMPFLLHRLLDEVVQLWRTQAQMKGLIFGLDVSSTAPKRLSGDPMRLRQVLNNLLSNAIKFTKSGSVTLEISHRQSLPASVVLQISVKDTGVGITPRQIERLFQPFVQADSSTTRQFGGSGLGLVICNRLVGLMGGSVAVESQVGQGSHFMVEVTLKEPLQPVDETENLMRSESDEGRYKEANACDGQKEETRPHGILVVEDNSFNQTVILAQLSKLGYQADLVEDGQQAVQAVKHRAYSLILMDCEMPVMDGFEATRQIRALGFVDVYIVALTAHAISGNRTKCLEAGMDFFFSKPLDLEYLARVLRKQSPAARPGAPEGSSATAFPWMTEGTHQSIFEPESLLARLMGDHELANVVVGAFVQDCPSQLENLRKLVAAGDAAGVRLQAHSLKGAAASVAAPHLSAIAAVLESTAETGNTERWPALLESAVAAHVQFRDLLQSQSWISTPLAKLQ